MTHRWKFRSACSSFHKGRRWDFPRNVAQQRMGPGILLLRSQSGPHRSRSLGLGESGWEALRLGAHSRIARCHPRPRNGMGTLGWRRLSCQLHLRPSTEFGLLDVCRPAHVERGVSDLASAREWPVGDQVPGHLYDFSDSSVLSEIDRSGFDIAWVDHLVLLLKKSSPLNEGCGLDMGVYSTHPSLVSKQVEECILPHQKSRPRSNKNRIL